ncbi:amidohydrolase family protein [Chloroflexota bacterium]
MKKIDTHCHIRYLEYQKELEKRGFATGTSGAAGEETSTKDWKEYAEARIANMDRLDIERQVLACPGYSPSLLADDEFNLYWVQASNDFLAQFCQKHPDRFSGFVGVPLFDVNLAIDELKRATKAQGMVGVVLSSHLGRLMLDSQQLMPFYEEVNKMGLTILIHPSLPIGFDEIEEYQQFSNLYKFIGYLFDSTMAVTRMVYRGIFEKYENINLIASHLGGILPFVCHSIDIMWEQNVIDGEETPPKPPSEYFRRFYADTARPLKAATLQCAIALYGEEHILFGSDMPNWVEEFNAPERIISTIEALDLPVIMKENIFYENARRLFNL